VFFLSVYSTFLQLYLLAQKRNYRLHHAAIARLEGYALPPERLLGSFASQYCMVTTVGASVAGTLGFAATGNGWWGLGVATLYAGALVGVALLRRR
jgi:hypothetical protein